MRNFDYRIEKSKAAMLEHFAKLQAVYDHHGETFDRIIAAMPAAIVRTDIDSSGLTISVAGDKHILAAAVRALRTNGYKTEKAPPKANDPNWTAYFEPVTKNEDLDWWLQEAGQIYLSFTSSVCRRVKVGQIQKTVTEDVYENVCGETEPAHAVSA